MKIAILADTHFGARGDSPTFHDYFSRFFREIFFPYIDKHKIKVVVHLGDLVDRRKFLNYTTAEVMRKQYIEPSALRRLETHVIAGNHDCAYKNHNEVNALREIVMGRPGFTIYSNPAEVLFCNDEPGRTSHKDFKALMLPWISPENEEKSAELLIGTNAQVCFAHLELVGFEMARGQMMDHGMDPNAFSKFKAVYTGHYHHKSSKGNIHYLGTPYEQNWSDYDDPKGFHVLDTETMKIEFIPNPITLFQRLVVDKTTKSNELDKALAGYMKGKIIKVIVKEGADRKVLEKFATELEKTAIDLQVIDEHLDIDVSGGQAIMIDNLEDTMKIVTDYVMASEIDADKTALIGLLKQLYVEAQGI